MSKKPRNLGANVISLDEERLARSLNKDFVSVGEVAEEIMRRLASMRKPLENKQ